MSKAKVSDEFAQFETRSGHQLEEARKAEKQARGNALPVGYHGTAVISDARAFVSKSKNKTIIVEATVVDCPNYEGKTAAILVQTIRDTENQTAAEAYARALDALEEFGLSRETREGDGGMAACFDELLNTPHYVSIDVVENPYSADKKGVNAFACPAPGSTSAASTPAAETTPETEDTSDLPQCLYLGKPHYIVRDNEDGTSDLKAVKTGKIREDVSNDDFEVTE